MNKNSIKNLPSFYTKYLDLVEEGEVLLTVLENAGIDCWFDVSAELEALELDTYANNKWTIPQLLQHIIDTERIFAFRALVASRNDGNNFPGFDEDAYAETALASARTIKELLEEFKLVRKTTALLFQSFHKDDFDKIIHVNNSTLTPRQIGFILIGHSRHHLNVVKERYFPLLRNE